MDLDQRVESVFNRTGIDSKVKYETVNNKPNVFPSNTPQPVELIVQGICVNCDNFGHCVWQHNNNINCQHYK